MQACCNFALAANPGRPMAYVAMPAAVVLINVRREMLVIGWFMARNVARFEAGRYVGRLADSDDCLTRVVFYRLRCYLNAMRGSREQIHLPSGHSFRVLRWERNLREVELVLAPDRRARIAGEGMHWH